MKASKTPADPDLLRARALINLSYEILSYRVGLVKELEYPKLHGYKLRCSENVADFALSLFPTLGLDIDREHFIALALNNKNSLSGIKVISTGSLTSSLVHPREVFHALITFRAASCVFLHNHPSGDPAPSPEDIDITKRLKECADFMGISFLDHVVIGTEGRSFSFSDRHML